MSRAVAPFMTAAVLAIVAAGVAIDRYVPIAVAPDGPGTAELGPDEGAWYCAVGDTLGDSELTAIVVGAADATSSLRIESFSEGVADDAHTVQIEPGTVHRQVIDAGKEHVGVLGVWSGAATMVARTWDRRVEGGPDGLVHGPCVASTTGTWYLPGVQTTGGSIARLEVANPFSTDAAISVRLLTGDGVEEPELLRNVAVSARSVRTIELNEFAPERGDLGAVVTTRSGRVIVEGWQTLDPGVGGVSGVTVVPLVTEPDERWTVPLVPEGATESWLTVANPDEREALLSVTVHTPDGAALPEGFEEVTVAAGSVRRIDLDGVLPEGVGAAAVSVTSENGVPVAVNGTGRYEHDEVERTGHVVITGAPEGDDRWILPGLRGRHGILQVVNTGPEGTSVDVRVATTDGLLTPSGLSGVGVEAGAVRRIDLSEHGDDLEDLGEHVYLVRSDGAAIIVALYSRAPEGPLRPVGLTGTPSAVWQPQVERRPIDHDPSLTRRIGTRLGPADTVEEEPPEPTPIPTPSPTPTPG